MPGLKYINRLSQLDRLIKFQCTGTSKDLASKLGISERQLFYYLSDLRELGADIRFNLFKKTYEYVKDYELHFF
ncbi:MAG: hypothetical protein HC905_25045 [Bacteroidales bacterium]|nr:hypothetical protein [Bacteroidales bacterium]